MSSSQNGDIPAFGYFSTPKSVGVDDPYVKKLAPDSRVTGRQFQTNAVRRGQTGDNWNSQHREVKVLFEDEKYQDPGSWVIKEKMEQKKKNLTNDGFKPSSPPKKWSGLGSHFGCIGPQLEHKEDDYEKKEKKGPEPRNVQTNPVKKGSFGYIGTTIGKAPEYQTDPFDRPHQMELTERKEHQKKVLAGPLKTMSHSVDYFDSYPNVAASKVYTIDRPLPPERSRPMSAPEIKVPFVPSHIPKIGHNSTLAPFPTYQTSLYDAKLLKDREEARQKQKKIIGGAYRPSSRPKSTPQPSIVARNITYNSISRGMA